MENYGIKSLKNVFYPRLNVLNEDQAEQQSEKITDKEFVYSKDGKKINVKRLIKEIDTCISIIINQSPAFGPYIHNLYPVYTWYVETMATDGYRLFINPAFADNLRWEQKLFVILHEIMHCVLLHMSRIKGRDATLSNIAADYEVNTLLVDTFDEFDQNFIKELNGLYKEEYTNFSFEKIYSLIKESGEHKKDQKQNQQKQKQKIEVNVGDKVRIKSTGKKGIVTQINSDGTYEVDTQGLNEKLIESLLMTSMLLESYDRDDLVPIIKPQQGKGQGGQQQEIEGEYEVEGSEGEDGEEGEDDDGGEEGKEGKSGKGKAAGEQGEQDDGSGEGDSPYDIFDETTDPGNAGVLITPQLGEEIAKKSGYDTDAGEASEKGKTTTSAGKKWETISKKVEESLADAQRENLSKGRGRGPGSALLARLEKLHRPQVDWKSTLKKFIGNALSPETRRRVPSRKYLQARYYRGEEVEEYTNIENVYVMVDTSGSMSSVMFEKISGEIAGIVFSKRVNKVKFVPFDDSILEDQVKVIKGKRQVYKLKTIPLQGGGTMDFQPVLDWAERDSKGKIKLMVFITDGYSSMPRKPSYDKRFLWVIYNNATFTMPWGKILNLTNVKM